MRNRSDGRRAVAAGNAGYPGLRGCWLAAVRNPSLLLLVGLALTVNCAGPVGSATARLALKTRLPLPTGYVPSSGNDLARWVAPTHALIQSFGLAIVTQPRPFIGGQWVPEDRTIYLASGLEANAHVELLLHEFGHVLTPVYVPRQVDARQAFAEGVSHAVCVRLGYDNSLHAAGYLRQFEDVWALKFFETEIERTAAWVAAAIRRGGP